MRTRDKERLERETAKMEANSRARLKWLRGKKDSEIELNIPESSAMRLPALPAPKEPKPLKWRKYLNTRRTHLKRTKRILVVEEIVKKKEVYTISGLNKSELNKVVEAIARS